MLRTRRLPMSQCARGASAQRMMSLRTRGELILLRTHVIGTALLKLPFESGIQ
jgi:hypothetical protein